MPDDQPPVTQVGKRSVPTPGYRYVGEPSAIEVAVYWRPGCSYCRRLRRALTRRGINAEYHNIWDDEAARSFVRQANRGDETVPTVRVGERVLINPTGAQVAALLPARAVDAAQPRQRARAAVAWLIRVTGR